MLPSRTRHVRRPATGHLAIVDDLAESRGKAGGGSRRARLTLGSWLDEENQECRTKSCTRTPALAAALGVALLAMGSEETAAQHDPQHAMPAPGASHGSGRPGL